ncbi:MAG: pyruvate ferredoxin oxidoreductase [Candidatus Aminicenantes bacterium]|nr:MAG: pyruvate ferredoxin oxidoreductase [Candidatus Aminicenantes bacterium]
MTLKELTLREDLFTAGHTLCPGCGIPVILKLVLRATQYPLVVSTATGCLQKGTSHFPCTSWKLNWIHNAVGNASATMSGIDAMYRSLKKQGKLPVGKELKFLVIGGDRATYDSGFQSLSGALERGEDFFYLCYDNQMCADTGGQSSSATPMGASTTTTPAGEVLPGKLLARKNICAIIASHNVPYVAQSAPWIWQDLYKKAEKAFEVSGPAYLNVLSPCPSEWKIPTHKTIELTKLAADTCVWPIYEIKHGKKITVNYKPKQKRPVTDWLKSQARFKHLLAQENKWIVDKIQEEVDREWDLLLSSEYKNEEKMRDN